MSTPDTTPPPPNSSAKKWLIGCLIAFVLLVVLGLAVLLLGIYAAKKQMDAMGTDAHKIYDEARRAAKALESSERIAPELAQGAEARMRLIRAAAAVATPDALKAEPCPAEPPRFPLTVDAAWFRELVEAAPASSEERPWFRHELFSAAPSISDANQAAALTELDQGLGDAGSVAVIHSTRLVEPKPLDGDKFEAGQFEGFVQLIGYPDGETICMAPFQATGSDPDEFHQQFLAAEEAALGR